MFESAVKKLTVWYVSALFIVCLAFSFPTYFIASNRLTQGALNQTEILKGLDGPVAVTSIPRQIALLRDEQLQRDRQQLFQTIVLANIFILCLGAYFSYRFAKHTLKPIEEAHDSQTRFTTDASHELRTPLATMQTEIEVALRDKKFDARAAKTVLKSNLEEIARLKNLSEQLLNLARLDSGELQKKVLSLSRLTEKEIVHLEKCTKAPINRTVEPNVVIQGDESLVRELLAILTDNAIKYAGQNPPEIAVSLQKKEGRAVLAVRDRGVGIKATEIPHVFDRFYRGTSATRQNASGHGLGLSLARQIVEAHEGKITVTSTPNKQTTFEISLPV
jgi:two-component system, OmpR family, sensor histidine kinase CiaH